MNRYVTTLILGLGFCNLFAQNFIKVNTYKTTDDYILRKFTDSDVTLQVKEIGEKHIWFKNFINDTTGKKWGKLNSSWAIEYNGENYFNLSYSGELNNHKLFIKLDMEGPHYCASFMDDESSKVIQNSSGNFGGGLQGVLLKSSTRWFTNWTDSTGNDKKILLIDLINQEQMFMSKNTISRGILLSKKDFKFLFKNKKSKFEVKKMSFEDIVEILDNENKIHHTINN